MKRAAAPRRRPDRGPLAVAALLALAAGVRALWFWGGFASWAHWDEVRLAIPAVHALEGTFAVYHVEVEHLGAAPAYPLAAWFALVGSSLLTLDLFCYAAGVGVAWTGYLVARRVLPRGPALVALAVLAIPPLLLARWSISGDLNYPGLLLIGNLVLLGTVAVVERPGAPAPLLVTGIVAGLGWWTHPLVVVYCVPLAVFALRAGLAWRGAAWLFPLGVLLGGLPTWLYEVAYFPTARLELHEAGSVGSGAPLVRAGLVATEVWPEFLGARARAFGWSPPAPVQLAVLALGGLVVARAIVRDRRTLAWLLGRRGDPGAGLGLLWGVVLANLALLIFTRRALGNFYLLPLYGVVPIWVAEAVGWLWTMRRSLGGAALAGLLGFHLAANAGVTVGRRDARPRWARQQAQLRPLFAWLRQHDLRRIYWAGAEPAMPAFEVTYLSGMHVMAAELWREPVVEHGHAVDAAASPPIVVTAAPLLELLRVGLQAVAVPFRESEVGGFVVLEPTLPPRGFAPIAPDGWTVTASHGAAPHHLADRDVATGWSTGGPQVPGQWLAVDLGREEEVTRIDLLAIDWQDVPAGFRVEASADGRRWTSLVSVPRYWGPFFVSEFHPFLRVRRGRVQAVFPPVRTRFLRIVQTGASPAHPWSARELFVYRPAPPGPPPPAPGVLAEALRREHVRFVYASPWLSARVLAESRGAIGALDSNLHVNSYGRTKPPPQALEPLRIEPGRGLLLGSDADVAGIARMLDAQGARVREASAGPFRLLLLAPGAPRRPLPRDRWRATATAAAPDAARALDGDRWTRWTARGPVDPTAAFTVDLGEVRPLTGVRLVHADREGEPEGYVVETSVDGRAWAAPGPLTWAGRLYWTGAELLRNGRTEWAVTFPRTPARYLRVRPADRAPGWEIAELEGFG